MRRYCVASRGNNHPKGDQGKIDTSDRDHPPTLPSTNILVDWAILVLHSAEGPLDRHFSAD